MNQRQHELLNHMKRLSLQLFNSEWEPDLDYMLLEITKAFPSTVNGVSTDRIDLQHLAHLLELTGGIWTNISQTDTPELMFYDWATWDNWCEIRP